MYQNIFVTSRTDEQESTVYIWDDVEGLIVTPYQDFGYAYKRDPKGQHTSMYGEKLKKVNFFKWDDPTLYESDLPRETRVLTDLYLDSDDPSTGHIVLNLDIETDNEGGFGSPETAEKTITAIANHASNTDTYTVFLLDPTGQIQDSTVGNEVLISCKTEEELLNRWLEYYHTLKPTIITGWNVDGYDIPYLYNRLKRVFDRDTAKSLSPIGIVTYNQNRGRFTIAGVSVLDYLALYKKFTYSQKPSYRLDAIATDEIGEGKIKYEGTLAQLYRSDIKKFVDYNLNDVKLVVGIDRKMKLIELARFICHIGHVPYEDFGYSSKFIEGTIITYLHRKGIIAANKPARLVESASDANILAGGDDEVGFTGAFVKFPMPGLYEWVYSLDLQSLYPSIIMSLNISPDTKLGRVYNWNVDSHMKKEIEKYEVQLGQERTKLMTRDEFIDFLNSNRISISSNGILYVNHKVGIIPEILDKWFADRVHYKGLMKKYVKEGNKELAEFYDRRQHVQKILLNSIYGVLGLSIFRFYDLDNALAVTATGQDVIKTTAKFINNQYKKRGVKPKTDQWCKLYRESMVKQAKGKPVPDVNPEDHCVYIDTDSVYFGAEPLFATYYVEDRCHTPEEWWQRQKNLTIQIAREMEAGVNKFYDTMAKLLFNCDKHRFYIKGESVMDTGFWVTKKRYAMKKVYDLETDKDVDKLAVKGLDVVRSSFPPAFAEFMSDVLMAILTKKPKEHLDKMVLEFKENIKQMSYLKVARNTSVKKVVEFDDPNEKSLTRFKSGAPAHSKAAVSYNRLIRKLGLENKYPLITDGDKIKWVYLKKNPYNLETMAIKTYDDPPQILELVEKYIDYDKLFEKELVNKLEDFYDAMTWGILPTEINQVASEFFSF
jgi:DNA polymerase elongation subunit (family B)